MRFTGVTLGVAVAVGLCLPSVAGACSLVLRTPKARVQAADIAVYGVVSSIRTLDGNGSPPSGFPVSGHFFEAKIRISRIFKGNPGSTLRIHGHTDEASCGFGELTAGRRLGLLLHRPGRPFRVTLGSQISLAELKQATGGRWRRPSAP